MVFSRVTFVLHRYLSSLLPAFVLGGGAVAKKNFGSVRHPAPHYGLKTTKTTKNSATDFFVTVVTAFIKTSYNIIRISVSGCDTIFKTANFVTFLLQSVTGCHRFVTGLCHTITYYITESYKKCDKKHPKN